MKHLLKKINTNRDCKIVFKHNYLINLRLALKTISTSASSVISVAEFISFKQFGLLYSCLNSSNRSPNRFTPLSGI